MVARTPPTHRKSMVAPPLSPTVLRETLLKVDQCMARLQELQYTATGGNKVVNGVKLSPRSTKAYFKTSLRCKQETIMRTRNNGTKRSPSGKLPATLAGEWRTMSLKSMLVGETVAEILQASKFTKEIMGNYSNIDDPKTPLSRKQRPIQEKTPIETRRKREKQHKFRIVEAQSITPSTKRARSRINFKVSPPKKSEFEKEKVGFSARYVTNKVSPKHKPWAKKTVLFPNPLFHSSPTSETQNICKTKSPVIGKKRETPHKFLVKSPVKIKSPQKGFVSVSPVSKLTSLSRISPPKQQMSKASKLRRSLSPSRLANRLVSPLKGRRNSMASSCDGLMSDLRHKPPALMMMPM
ncbi:hypothetical protein KSS87_016985, partial [Heliosperma pusillum]